MKHEKFFFFFLFRSLFFKKFIQIFFFLFFLFFFLVIFQSLVFFLSVYAFHGFLSLILIILELCSSCVCVRFSKERISSICKYVVLVVDCEHDIAQKFKHEEQENVVVQNNDRFLISNRKYISMNLINGNGSYKRITLFCVFMCICV